jgi:hypothetical protein
MVLSYVVLESVVLLLDVVVDDPLEHPAIDARLADAIAKPAICVKPLRVRKMFFMISPSSFNHSVSNWLCINSMTKSNNSIWQVIRNRSLFHVGEGITGVACVGCGPRGVRK